MVFEKSPFEHRIDRAFEGFEEELKTARGNPPGDSFESTHAEDELIAKDLLVREYIAFRGLGNGLARSNGRYWVVLRWLVLRTRPTKRAAPGPKAPPASIEPIGLVVLTAKTWLGKIGNFIVLKACRHQDSSCRLIHLQFELIFNGRYLSTLQQTNSLAPFSIVRP